MNEFLKVALTACIPAMTVIFGWGLNKGVSIANGYIKTSLRRPVSRMPPTRCLTLSSMSTRPTLMP